MDGVQPVEEKFEAKQMPIPKLVKDLRCAVGFFSYYWGFLPEFASLTAELSAMTSQNCFNWTEKHTAAFECLKIAFHNVKPWKRLVVNKETLSYDKLVLSIDFSKTAVAAILGQVQNSVKQFISTTSWKCLEYEQWYHLSKGEFLALVFGIKKFETVLCH